MNESLEAKAQMLLSMAAAYTAPIARAFADHPTASICVLTDGEEEGTIELSAYTVEQWEEMVTENTDPIALAVITPPENVREKSWVLLLTSEHGASWIPLTAVYKCAQEQLSASGAKPN
jgi:hypothetical protein